MKKKEKEMEFSSPVETISEMLQPIGNLTLTPDQKYLAEIAAAVAVDERGHPNFTTQFTGVARSYVCCITNDRFRCFKILTLHIENGVVVKAEKSIPYATFEAMSQAELLMDKSAIKLNNEWTHGKAMSA